MSDTVTRPEDLPEWARVVVVCPRAVMSFDFRCVAMFMAPHPLAGACVNLRTPGLQLVTGQVIPEVGHIYELHRDALAGALEWVSAVQAPRRGMGVLGLNADVPEVATVEQTDDKRQFLREVTL